MTPTRLIDATPIADDWQLIRIPWQPNPKAEQPTPGQWLWLEANDQRVCLPLRDLHAKEGWIAGVMPAALLPAGLGPGSPVHVSEMMGEPASTPDTDSIIVVAEDVGIGAALHFAERNAEQIDLIILGGQFGIPARLVPSRFYLPTLSSTAIAGVAALEAIGVPARIALYEDRPGVYEGDALDLLGLYLSDLPASARSSITAVSFMPWGRCRAMDVKAQLQAAVGGVQWFEYPSKNPPG